MNKISLVTFIMFSVIQSAYPDAIGEKGVVTSSNESASQIGIEILTPY